MASNTADFYTYSKSAGTAKNLQKPTDGGDNNVWGGYINTDLDSIVSAVNATSDLIADANQNELVNFTATGSAVNHIGISNKATGSGPVIEAVGDDTNIDLNLNGKGTGKVAATSPKITTGINDSNNNELIKVTATGSAVNEITVANSAAGGGPTISATGGDTNIDLNISGKGTGDPKMVDLKVTNIKANDGTAGLVIADSSGQVTGTLGSATVFPSGHIIQIQNTFVGDDFETTDSSYVDVPGVSCAITPVKTGSKILVFVSCSLGGGTSNTQGSLQLQRDIAGGGYSGVGGGTAEDQRVSGIANVAITPGEGTNQVGFHFRDAPSYSAGNAITYKLKCKAQAGSFSIYIGRSRFDGNAVYNTRMPTVLTLMEVAA